MLWPMPVPLTPSCAALAVSAAQTLHLKTNRPTVLLPWISISLHLILSISLILKHSLQFIFFVAAPLLTPYIWPPGLLFLYLGQFFVFSSNFQLLLILHDIIIITSVLLNFPFTFVYKTQCVCQHSLKNTRTSTYLLISRETRYLCHYIIFHRSTSIFGFLSASQMSRIYNRPSETQGTVLALQRWPCLADRAGWPPFLCIPSTPLPSYRQTMHSVKSNRGLSTQLWNIFSHFQRFSPVNKTLKHTEQSIHLKLL